MKGLRLSIWKTKDLRIGGKNLIDINYANISDQIKLIGTIKFYQKPLATLAKSTQENKKQNIRTSMIIFLETHPKYKDRYPTLTLENREWIISYLSSSKGVIPYESIKSRED